MSAAVGAAGLGLVAFSAFALPGQLDGGLGSRGLGSRIAELACALVIPVAGLVAGWMSDAAVRLTARREHTPALVWPVLALAGAAVAFTAWALLYFA
ncbi:MAG: hypothetical protein QOG15_2669 [Solirubrobacteraceae bacterium]|nr:hypothetical protein [Solirubrobacteraceae bacterium]